MLEGNHLILSGEDHVVLTDDGASADSLDSDLILLALLPRLGAVVLIVVVVVHRLIDGVSQRQSGSAGRVHLFIVVLFQNFDVETGLCQNLCRLYHQL